METEINLRMRIIDFSLALADASRRRNLTLRQHAEVDAKDNLGRTDYRWFL
jgi:hypothetical protein